MSYNRTQDGPRCRKCSDRGWLWSNGLRINCDCAIGQRQIEGMPDEPEERDPGPPPPLEDRAAYLWPEVPWR